MFAKSCMELFSILSIGFSLKTLLHAERSYYNLI